MDTPNSTITFRFEGRLADQGQLDFYEASRFHYAAARFLYTLQGLAEHGKVSERITPSIANTRFRIAGNRPACWEMDVVEILQSVTATAISVPISILIQHTLQLLFPPRKQAGTIATKDVRELVKINQEPLMEALKIIKSNELHRHQEMDKMLEIIRDAKTPSLRNQKKPLS